MKLNENLSLNEITNPEDPLILRLQNTYISSFPTVERRNFSFFTTLLVAEPAFKAFVILNDNEYVGFITCWEFEEFVYVEHFALDENKRSGGIGSKTMRLVLSTFFKPVVLEVELAVDDLTARRIKFYETLGFTLHGQAYRQPPYREGDPWTDMKLMTHGDLDMNTQFELVKDLIYSHVYDIKKA